jgi:dTDP-4-amino-4,6-dideoxygalactose transaminase
VDRDPWQRTIPILTHGFYQWDDPLYKEVFMEKLAIHGGEQVHPSNWPDWPVFDETEKKALMQVLESRVWWRTPGTQTLAFEQEFALYHDAKFGIAVTNGTAALEVAIAALGIGPGDEVVVPDFTFVATASAVLACGAMPVMVDCTPDTYCIDPKLAEEAITPHTQAIIAVHMGGHPAQLDDLVEICRKHRIRLVEDSAHAHGTEWKGRKIGAIGDIGTFSFQASKLMTAGEGGMIITNDPELERRARSIHDCGRMPEEWFYAHFIYGSNYRLSEWQGAILRCQLSRADEQRAVRTRNSNYLDRAFAGIHGITPQAKDPGCTCNGHYAYIFHYDPSAFENLPITRFVEALNAEGIPTQASYPPVHELAVFQNGEFRKRLSGDQAAQDFPFLRAKFPHTAKAAWETVWLPQPVLLGDEKDMQSVVAAIQKIQRHAEELSLQTVGAK